jgi:hypothetical protein
MTINLYTFDGAVLGAAAAKQGTDVPTLTQRTIVAATLTNTTGAAIAATVYLAPSGGNAAANMVISARTISAGETYVCPEMINQSINAGGAVWALGNGLSFKYAAKDIS